MSPGVRRVAGAAWLPALLAGVGVVEMAALRPAMWGSGAAVEVIACGVLCARRRFPLAAPLTAMTLMILLPVLGTPLDQPATPIAVWALSFFSLGRYVGDRRRMLGFAVVMVGVFVDYHWFDDRKHNISDVVFVAVLAAPPFILGQLMRRLASQKEALERAQELIRAQAVREERDRIARDLHDVIAHSVSAMVVQTAAAQDVVRSDPGRAEEILAAVAETGRGALAETGRLLHVLRDTADELGLQPAPGLAQVPGLVDRFRAEGLRVDLRIDEPVPVLPPGVDVSAYRIVQESLTNALRYASDGAVQVTVTADPERVGISAVNRVGGRRADGSGLGLLGMAERVAVLGGSLTHGIHESGRFELEATLPVAP